MQNAADASKTARNALALLFCAYALSITDRMILSVLFEPIRLEFGASDTQMGLLGGLTFALFYATLGVPIARLADRQQRRLIIVFSLALFSLMTAMSGLATSFLLLFLFRIGVGIGEAGVNPASQSIIADYYPPQRRGMAMSVLAVGAQAGMIVGFLVGGTVSEYYGWRAALFAVGLPGLALAAFILLKLREPVRGNSEDQTTHPDEQKSVSFLDSVKFMVTHPAMRQLIIASTLTSLGTYGLSTWLPTLFIRVHELSQSQVGLLMAGLFGCLGAAGTLIGGKLFDRLSLKAPGLGVRMIAITQLVMIPFALAAYSFDSLPLAICFFTVPAFVGGVFLGPSLALIQTLSPLRMRATAAAIKMFCLNLVGMSLGPLFVGLISDALMPTYGVQSLPIALGALSIFGIWPALHYWLCGRALERAATQEN